MINFKYSLQFLDFRKEIISFKELFMKKNLVIGGSIVLSFITGIILYNFVFGSEQYYKTIAEAKANNPNNAKPILVKVTESW